ncbi:MAG: hypothetical protein IFK92_11810 [Acidobacteria bacterium]|nr:hypothetical protein [Candidatus Sulfomarinibacter kjeldsenii]
MRTRARVARGGGCGGGGHGRVSLASQGGPTWRHLAELPTQTVRGFEADR